MKSRPILFSAPMVRALLDGTKTQTRRFAKIKDVINHPQSPTVKIVTMEGVGKQFWGNSQVDHPNHISKACPYGQVGDQLWVRESFDFLPAGGPDQPQACQIVYWATGTTEPRDAPIDYNPMIYAHEKVRPSIHMPRFASRITFEITSVRVERLQDISEADATADGTPHSLNHPAGRTAVDNYIHLWETINGDGSWDLNPWVWVIEFKKVAA